MSVLTVDRRHYFGHIPRSCLVEPLDSIPLGLDHLPYKGPSYRMVVSISSDSGDPLDAVVEFDRDMNMVETCWKVLRVELNRTRDCTSRSKGLCSSDDIERFDDRH